MILSDIDFELQGQTVVTDALETTSGWLIEYFRNNGSLMVCFRDSCRDASQFPSIDLSGSLFTTSNGKFASINLDNLAQQIKSQSPQRLILEHPDLLVSSGLISPAALLDWIESVSAPQTIISVCTHKGLLEQYPVCKAASKLVISLLHSASQQIKVSPLATGYSTEYNGTIELIGQKDPREYLFQIEKDTIRIYKR